MHELIDTCQRQAIQQALALHDGNWAAAARMLALDASNLHKLARRLGLKGPADSRAASPSPRPGARTERERSSA